MNAPSKSEAVLLSLADALLAALPPGALFARNLYLPETVPAAGLVILRDGDPGEPFALMSPPSYIYEHRAEIDVLVDLADPDERDAVFDGLKLAIGAGIAADRTLGGLCDYVLGDAPIISELPIEGAEGVKASTIIVTLVYATADPLA